MLRFVRDAIYRRSVLAKCHVAFEASLHSDHRPDKERDYSIVSDHKPDVPFLPGPAREGHGKEVDAKKGQPKRKPRRFVNVGLRDLRIEIRLSEGRDRAGNGDGRQQDERELQRSEACESLARQPNAFGVQRSSACERGQMRQLRSWAAQHADYDLHSPRILFR